jgi:hypothetical protein
VEECAQLQNAVNEQAEPEIDYRAEFDRPGPMARGGGQMRRQRKVQAIAQQDGYQKLEKLGAIGFHESEATEGGGFGRDGDGFN